MQEVFLRPICVDDTDNVVRWRNSEQVKRNLFSQEDITHDSHLEYLKKYVETGKCKQYIIETKDSHLDIGTVFIKNIDEYNRKAEFGIMIGEDGARGKGYGTAATNQMLKIAFEENNMNRIYLHVLEENLAGIKAYLKAGFINEGLLREEFRRGNQYCNVVVMGITYGRWHHQNNGDYADC